MASSVQVEPSAVRDDLLPELAKHGFDLERTNLTAFAKSCKKGGSWESQSSFKTIVSVKGAYPSCLTAMCSNTLPIFLRALTCSWCFSLLRPETVETTPESSDRLNPVYDKEKEVESTGQPKTVPEPSSFFANNNSSDPEWQGRDSLIGESEWYSSWGAATLVIASTKTNVTGKNRAADGGYDPFYDPLRITPRGLLQHLCCVKAIRKCGTPEFCSTFCLSFMIGILAFFAFPLIIFAILWDFIAFPVLSIVGCVLGLVLFEPIGCALRCCCGMSSSRGAVMVAAVVHSYTTTSGYGKESSTTSHDDVIAEVVLAERVNVIKACCIGAGGSYPRLSQRDYLVRNPVWGLFEKDIPVHEIASAWHELVKRVGGQIPQIDVSNAPWKNGHTIVES